MNLNFPASFHNVAELEPVQTPFPGLTLRRFPRSVRDDPTLSPIGHKFTAHTSNGCEIRFISTSAVVRVSLTTTSDHAAVVVLRGEYQYQSSPFPLVPNRITTIQLTAPNYSERSALAFSGDRFPNTLWRIYSLDTTITLCDIEPAGDNARAPSKDEQPKLRWLAYGSSITQCGDEYTGYLNVAAQLLGVDALNLGMGGSCFMEESVGKFIAGRDDWNFATLELGINVLGQLTVEEFALRARRLIQTVHQAHSDKPVFVVTTFRNGLDYATKSNPTWVEANRRHREILAEIVGEINSPQVQLLDGKAIFTDFIGFHADLLHPAALASSRAGERLASLLRERLGAKLKS